tara:strand:+ start:128 stop:985 length:858 start_codon:yes stop_codon:yes gene_type:complete
MSEGTVISFGCSHTAGSEIDSLGDSDYNRQHSYGAHLAKKFGYDHMNFALCGGSNQRIFVLTTQVLKEIIVGTCNLVPHLRKNHKYFFLIGWTSLNRFDLRYSNDGSMLSKAEIRSQVYEQCGDAGDKLDNKIIPACLGMNPNIINDKDLRRTIKYIPYIADNVVMADQLASYIFTLQTMLETNNIDYYMFNAIENHFQTDYFSRDRLDHNAEPTWRPGNTILYDNIDETKYYHPKSYTENYYRWCLSKGHTNQSNKYWHLGEPAHIDWADHIYPEILNAYPNLG